jgi:hypothetical protein
MVLQIDHNRDHLITLAADANRGLPLSGACSPASLVNWLATRLASKESDSGQTPLQLLLDGPLPIRLNRSGANGCEAEIRMTVIHDVHPMLERVDTLGVPNAH